MKPFLLTPDSETARLLMEGERRHKAGAAVAALRPIEAGDGPQIHAGLRESMAQIALWMSWCHPQYSLEDACRWVKSRSSAWAIGEAYDFAILDPQSLEVAGVCGLTSLSRDNNFANLGYWVRTSCAGRGLATQATRAVARFGFDWLGLGRIEIVVAEGNAASQRVAQKAGALREGVLRNRSVVSGRALNAVMYSLVPEDFSADRL